jgi:hypothetical protein
MSSKSFEIFLKYVYLDKLDLEDIHLAIQFLDICDFYQMPDKYVSLPFPLLSSLSSPSSLLPFSLFPSSLPSCLFYVSVSLPYAFSVFVLAETLLEKLLDASTCIIFYGLIYNKPYVAHFPFLMGGYKRGKKRKLKAEKARKEGGMLSKMKINLN